MTRKEIFIEMMKYKTKNFAIQIIHFCDSLKKTEASKVITYQMIKSATSTGANYRAACKSRSKKEFFSKLCIVAEESDETIYWLDVIDGADISNDSRELEKLKQEAKEITKIISKAKDTIYNTGF